jgi:hypothetical protein
MEGDGQLSSLEMRTIYDAAGGEGGMLRLAHAWHARVMRDEVVSHAFSHGFDPAHTERLAAYWGEALGGRPCIQLRTVMRAPSCACTAAMVRTKIWTSGRSSVLTRHWSTLGLPTTSHCVTCCTTTLRGQPRPRCRGITIPRTTSLRAFKFPAGPGTDSSAGWLSDATKVQNLYLT